LVLVRGALDEMGEPYHRPVEFDQNLAARCVALTASLGLAFAGIDLKVTAHGEVYCFEVNPCPAYSFYEQSTGQRISRALAAWLAQRGPKMTRA
jgi:glutathione synthase/RimK-type ligase-like ATP-grasp enzyme